MGERRVAYRVLVRKPEGKRPLGKSMRIWKDNITMDLQDVDRIRWIGSLWLWIAAGGRLL